MTPQEPKVLPEIQNSAREVIWEGDENSFAGQSGAETTEDCVLERRLPRMPALRATLSLQGSLCEDSRLGAKSALSPCVGLPGREPFNSRGQHPRNKDGKISLTLEGSIKTLNERLRYRPFQGRNPGRTLCKRTVLLSPGGVAPGMVSSPFRARDSIEPFQPRQGSPVSSRRR